MLILPAFGLISDILSKFSQCIIFGRDSMLVALLVIGFLLTLCSWIFLSGSICLNHVYSYATFQSSSLL